MIRLQGDVDPPDDWAADVADDAVRLVAVSDADAPVGVVTVTLEGVSARVGTLWVRPALRRRGIGRAMLAALRAWLGEREVRSAGLAVDAGDLADAGHALLAGHTIQNEYMVREVPAVPSPLPAGFGYRPMTAAEFEPWRDLHVAGYAASNLSRMGGDAEAAAERSRRSFADLLPDGLATADQTIVVLTHDGVRVGDLWLAHHRDGGETFGFDLEIDADRRGEGFGRAAMAVGERLAAQAGDTRVGLNVFGDNSVARNLYRSWGFTPSATVYDVMSNDVMSPCDDHHI